MRAAVLGTGRMGTALAERLLDGGHDVDVWNRTRRAAPAAGGRSAGWLDSPDALAPGTRAVFLCLSDDATCLEVGAPGGRARAAWSDTWVAATSTVGAGTLEELGGVYGERLLATPVIGAPAAVRAGAATFILSGPASARTELADIWELFQGPIEAGPSRRDATTIKLLHNQLLLTGLAVLAETVRIGRGGGLPDETIESLLRTLAVVPQGLHNRIDGLFDPEHRGWFTNPLAAKDLTLALAIDGDSAPLPVTSAARDAYRAVVDAGWTTQDITALVELGGARRDT